MKAPFLRLSFFCAPLFLRLSFFAPPSGHSSVSRPPRPGRRKPPFAGDSPFAESRCRGDNLCRGVWGRTGLIRPDRRPLFLRRRQGTLPFPVPRVQAGGNRRLQATARSPNRGAGVITSAAGFGAAQAPSAPDRRPSQRSASFFLFRGQKNKPKTGTKIIPAIRPKRAYQTMETLTRFPENFKKLSGGSKI